MPLESLRKTVLASLMAALTAVGAYLFIPVGPVPIVLSSLFVLLSGLFLGSRWGLTSVLIYLFVGAIGLPVFSGGRGGIVHILGPTGGYLFGYALSAWSSGLISERRRGSALFDILAILIGSLAIYGIGVPWLKWVANLTWEKSLLVGIVPFLIGDALKGAAAFILARSVRPILNRQEESLRTDVFGNGTRKKDTSLQLK